MSDGPFPDGDVPDGGRPAEAFEPTTAMPITPGPANAGSFGPPPGTPPADGGDGFDQGQPPWVVPAIVGIAVVAVVLLALIFTRGGDEDDALPAVDTSTTTTLPDTTAPATTLEVAPDTTVDVTTTVEPEATTTSPETTIEATTTTTAAPDTTVAPTTAVPTTVAPAPSTPTAQPADSIGPNTASLATVAGEQTFAVIGTCASTPTTGLQAISSVLANQSGTVYVVDIYLDEGGEPFVEVADMTESIAGFVFGQDTGGGNARWVADIADPTAIDRVTLTALDGTSDPIALSMNSNGPTECGRGFVTSPTPFDAAGPIELVDRFDLADPGSGFAVLAACDNGVSYVTSGGGLIDVSSPANSDTFSSSYFVDLPQNSTFWSTPDGITPSQQTVVQNGGGTDYATHVVGGSNDQLGYLSVRLQPTGNGGPTQVNCSA